LQGELSITVENYIKTVYEGTEDDRSDVYPLSSMAKRLEVTPGTVTVMAKRIAKDGLLEYIPRKGCKLTVKGKVSGRTIVRKHRLLELFLVNVLKMDWSEVHEEAERLEHAVSERLLECLDEFLGYPEYDPHGKRIPREANEFPVRESGYSLTSGASGTRHIIRSIDDTSRGLLKILGKADVYPGSMIKILSNDPCSGTITFSTSDNKEITLGLQAARVIIVKEAVE
jgi:DtxR family transcriptional regulator, Mn-dependent transcriptional regulator